MSDPATIALAMLPPYDASPWLSMGLVLIRGLLAEARIPARILRLLDDPTASPEAVIDTSAHTAWSSPPLDERLTRIGDIAHTHAPWFQALLDQLASIQEPILGLSVWRHNADVTLEITRRLKHLRPGLTIVLGGPESVTSPHDLTQPWIDAVVSQRAEAVAVPLFRALLQKTPADAALEGVWLNPHNLPQTPPSTRPRPETGPIPPLDYQHLLELVRENPKPDIPFLLNLGCPFRCVFCSNTTLYPDLQFRDANRVAAEMDQAVRAWQHLHQNTEAPPLSLTLCDAAANAWPAQFDALCDAIAAAGWTTATSLQAMIIVDGRITPERVTRYLAAGLTQPFFGLETASERLRRRVKKPGHIDEVAKALETIHHASRGLMKVSLNVIVGFPDETDHDYQQTLDFLDWAVGLGVISELGVMPLVRTPESMDRRLLAAAEGPERGYDWRMPGPGGDPNTRARRFLGVFEHFSGRVTVSSPIPRDHLIRRLLPDLDGDALSAWIERHGRVSTYFESQPKRPTSASTEAIAPASPEPKADENNWPFLVGELLRQAKARGGFPGWSLAEVEATENGALAIFTRAQAIQAIDFAPDTLGRPALAKAAGFSLSYRRDWRGRPCEGRPDWVRALASDLDRLLGSPQRRRLPLA